MKRISFKAILLCQNQREKHAVGRVQVWMFSDGENVMDISDSSATTAASISRPRTRGGGTKSNEQVWFRKWIIERQTLPLISRDSELSISTLQRKFYDYLKEYLTWTMPQCRVVHLVIDGTDFTNKICLFVYRENDIQETLLYRILKRQYHFIVDSHTTTFETS